MNSRANTWPKHSQYCTQDTTGAFRCFWSLLAYMLRTTFCKYSRLKGQKPVKVGSQCDRAVTAIHQGRSNTQCWKGGTRKRRP
jgi:hypothetical protein